MIMIVRFSFLYILIYFSHFCDIGSDLIDHSIYWIMLWKGLRDQFRVLSVILPSSCQVCMFSACMHAYVLSVTRWGEHRDCQIPITSLFRHLKIIIVINGRVKLFTKTIFTWCHYWRNLPKKIARDKIFIVFSKTYSCLLNIVIVSMCVGSFYDVWVFAQMKINQVLLYSILLIHILWWRNSSVIRYVIYILQIITYR